MSEDITASVAANFRQVGGRHYKTGGIEHWDLMHDCNVPYLLGCASKYVARHRNKGGRLDLEKAVHYLEKYQEKVGPNTHLPDWRITTVCLIDWVAQADIPAKEIRILHTMLYIRDIPGALEQLRELIEWAYPEKQEKVSGPGTPEDGGHHARQPQEVEEGETIRQWDTDL
jgi:Protein of unknwon function (DUF3310)